MAELIAKGTSALESASFTLAAGEEVTLMLDSTGAPDINRCSVAVQYQTASSDWFTFLELNQKNPIEVVAAQGVYRVCRSQCELPVGVDKVGP